MDENQASPNPTIRPNQSKVPPALRMLFQDQAESSDTYQVPGFNGPAPASSFLPLPLLAPPRGRGRSKSGTSPQHSEQEEEVLTAKQPTFEFPPRASTPRSVSRQGGDSDPFTDVGAPKRERLPPLGVGIPRAQGPMVNSESPHEISATVSLFGASDTEIPRLEGGSVAASILADAASSVDFSHPLDKLSARPSRPTATRQRSKSNGIEPPDPPPSRHEWDFPSKEFQFPPPGFTSDSALPAPSRMKTHNRISPTHASASTVSSTANSSRSSHQFTQSLDASVLPRRLPSPTSLMPTPPNMSRSRSAIPFGETSSEVRPNSNALSALPKPVPKKPSMTRLASVAVMETVQTPSRPYPRQREGLNGSLSDIEPPLPGLKDVLKVMPRCTLLIILTDWGVSADSFSNIRAQAWHVRFIATIPFGDSIS